METKKMNLKRAQGNKRALLMRRTSTNEDDKRVTRTKFDSHEFCQLEGEREHTCVAKVLVKVGKNCFLETNVYM